MKLTIKKGTTSKLIQIFILDTSQEDGSGLTGLVHNSAGLTAYYFREGSASTSVISLVNAVVGTWTSGGFKEVDDTNMPGVYEIGIPNACIASGSEQVIIFMRGALKMVNIPMEIQLDDNTAKDVYDRVPSDLGDVPTKSELNTDHGSGSWESAIPPTVSDIVDGILDEDLTEHNIANTAGKILKQIKNAIGAIIGFVS